MKSFNDKDMMRQIMIDHSEEPIHKVDDETKLGNYLSFHNKSSSCIDDIKVFVKIETNKILDAKFLGLGCVISVSSTDILCDILIGKTIEKANVILKQYFAMIAHESFDEDILDELIIFKDIYQQANRIKCSLIGANAFKGVLNEKK